MNNTSTKSELKAHFNRCVKGKNIMTPKQIGFFETKSYIIELSKGENFKGDDIFGVSFLDKNTDKLDHDGISKMLNSKKEAIEYINSFLV